MRAKFFPAAVLLLGLSPAAGAALISITNAGFENPAVEFFDAGNIPGWVIAGSGAGVWNLNDTPTSYWGVLAPEGKQVGFVGRDDPGGPASISQVLGAVLLADSQYTLTGYVGHPQGAGESRKPATVYMVELLAGNTLLQSISGTGMEGSFISFQLQFNSTGSAVVGQTLSIRLSSNQAQSAFDDLELNAAAVPEPATFAATAAALACLLATNRQRNRRRHRSGCDRVSARPPAL